MRVDLAILVPLYNEVENVRPLAAEILRAMAGQEIPFAVWLVDDGSTDGTWECIQELAARQTEIHGLRHAVNSGQSAAFWTGVRATKAAWIATLDGDRQNDPADLPLLLARLPEADFVCGVRLKREDTLLRRVSSRVARWARRWALGVDFRDTGCFLRAFKREALDGVLPFNGWHRFLPVLVHGAGWKVVEVPVHHRERMAGCSKYGVWNRLGRGIRDLVGVAWYLQRRLRPVPYEQTPLGGRPTVHVDVS